jgi:hypothetical protein
MLTEKLLLMSPHKRTLNWAIYQTFRQIKDVTQITCATRFIGVLVNRTLVGFAHNPILVHGACLKGGFGTEAGKGEMIVDFGLGIEDWGVEGVKTEDGSQKREKSVVFGGSDEEGEDIEERTDSKGAGCLTVRRGKGRGATSPRRSSARSVAEWQSRAGVSGQAYRRSWNPGNLQNAQPP